MLKGKEAAKQQTFEKKRYLPVKNIVPLLGYFEDEYNVYLIMEFCNGGDLYQYLVEKKSAALSFPNE